MKDDNTMDVEKMKQRLNYIKIRNPELFEKLAQLLDDCKAKGYNLFVTYIIEKYKF